MTPGFIQPLTTALLIEKLRYTIAKVRPDQRISQTFGSPSIASTSGQTGAYMLLDYWMVHLFRAWPF